jgi:hypothetical protein
MKQQKKEKEMIYNYNCNDNNKTYLCGVTVVILLLLVVVGGGIDFTNLLFVEVEEIAVTPALAKEEVLAAIDLLGVTVGLFEGEGEMMDCFLEAGCLAIEVTEDFLVDDNDGFFVVVSSSFLLLVLLLAAD